MQIDTGRGDECPLTGVRVDLDGSKPALRQCRFCGGLHGVLTGPKGPHHDGVRCDTCLKFLGWLPPPDSNFSLIE